MFVKVEFLGRSQRCTVFYHIIDRAPILCSLPSSQELIFGIYLALALLEQSVISCDLLLQQTCSA